MDTTTVLLIAIPVLVVLAGVLLFAAARRRDTGEAIGLLSRETRKRDRGTVVPSDTTATVASGRDVERAAALERREASKALATVEPKAPVAWVPPDPDVLGVTRRQFFNRGILAFWGLGLSGFGASIVAFLWPQVTGGFGAAINIGSVTAVEGRIEDGVGFAYYPEGRMWVTRYPREALGRAEVAYGDAPGVLEGMQAGFVALYQKCPHLGCRVPECVTSQWFECPCHGSQYNRVGEKKGGPAPRGMDRFPISMQGTNLVVDTGTIVQGPPVGTNTTGQEAEGPNCLQAGGH
jgi:cytochrome b6-f complex iron-sulfur subunit